MDSNIQKSYLLLKTARFRSLSRFFHYLLCIIKLQPHYPSLVDKLLI